MSKIIGYVAFFLILIYPLGILSQECNNAVPATTSDLKDNGNGTVSDAKTGLVWKKCNEGQSWNAVLNSCDGKANRYTWQAALERAQALNNNSEGENFGKTDWRLPNIKELASILERQCYDPSINTSFFPSSFFPYTSSSLYWSSSPYVFSALAWGVNLYVGRVNTFIKSSRNSVRLVR